MIVEYNYGQKHVCDMFKVVIGWQWSKAQPLRMIIVLGEMRIILIAMHVS